MKPKKTAETKPQQAVPFKVNPYIDRAEQQVFEAITIRDTVKPIEKKGIWKVFKRFLNYKLNRK